MAPSGSQNSSRSGAVEEGSRPYPPAMSSLDWLVIGGYLALVLIIGLRVSRRSDSADDLLLAGRGLGPTAVMLSLIATELSAATFIGVPQNSFDQMSWYYLQFAFGALIAKVLLSRTLVPLYHRLGVKTVYGLIEHSFGPVAWRGTALAFVVGRILASGVRLYLAAIAFSALTQLSMEFSVLICASIAGTYAGIGGIRSVIATDVIQGGVFIVSALALLSVAVASIPGGVETFLDWMSQTDSTQIIFWPSEVAHQGGGVASLAGGPMASRCRWRSSEVSFSPWRLMGPTTTWFSGC